jgi:tricorn protease interacting factor F2/3
MQEVNPINYRIHLEPDLVNFKVSGQLEVLLEALKPVDEIVLNSLEIAIWQCAVMVADDFTVCPFEVHPVQEELRISLPNKMSGKIILKIDYQGHINDKMAGFYRSKYVADGEIKYIAVTQFEESDARRAFPCLDHPSKKATFEIEMIVDETLVAISNGIILKEHPLDGGKKRVKFQKTPKMSTYLVFFGVGQFESVANQQDQRVRLVSIPGMTKYTRFGLEFGAKALRYCEKYYQIPYPLPKLDLIAIPDFAFGAMENWGAITFRENLLLHYPDITSKSGEERICEVIAHEIAHQWFGNLVTPSDWKYLWLNESFATYFGYGVVDHYFPKWETWHQFIHGQTHSAFVRDGLNETFAIEIPGGDHVVINSSTAPIIYSKGASILRQIEGYIGSDNFRNGLRYYLKQHEYGGASSHHLWEALEEVSKKPVTSMMKSWIEQPGYPTIEVDRDGRELTLAQKKFTYLPNTSDQKWLIPIQLKVYYSNGDVKVMTTLLEEKNTRIDIGENVVAYKINNRQTGFYRVKYNNHSDFETIGDFIRNKQLPPEDRCGVQNDLFALVRSAQISIDTYLDYLSNYQAEDAFLPLASIASNLFQAYQVLDGAKKEKIAVIGKTLIERTLGIIGYNPSPEEPHTTSILRDQVIWQAVLYGSMQATEFAADQFRYLLQGDSVHPDIQKSILQVGALTEEGIAYEWLVERLQSSESEHERMNILIAIGSFGDENLIKKTLQYVLDHVPDRNKFVTIVAMASNPHAVDYMWPWYVSHLSGLERFHPIHYERVIGGIVPICGIGKAKEVKRFFNQYLPRNQQAKGIIKLSLEKLEINLRMRNAKFF